MADDYEKMSEPKRGNRKPRRGEPNGPPGRAKLVAPDKVGKREEPKASKTIDDDSLREIAEKVAEAYEVEKENIEAAYDDLLKLAGEQWPDYAKAARKGRPMLTINLLPQFKRQITGDIRLGRFGVRVTPADGEGRKEVAEILGGMIRYIQNRSEAKAAFSLAADQMASCGAGAMRVITEYADETTFNQECRIVQIDDGVSVLWDPDSKLPTREDATWCLVPVDMSERKFKKKYPDVPVQDFAAHDTAAFWLRDGTVRVGEFWEKRPTKKRLALMPDGSIVDVTDKDKGEVSKLKSQGAKFRDRDGYKVYRSLVTLGHYLEEPEEWPGHIIPIAPMIGEEIRIGRRIVRHGIVRFAKEPQMIYNFNVSQDAEMKALAPKAPFIGTRKNFEQNPDEWAQANTENLPYLEYDPDSANGGQAPQRNVPAFPNSGLEASMARAERDIKGTTGIYDPSLGNRSNEVSGIAINARERQTDVANVIYVDNFMLTMRHVGRILIDLIPKVYDTEREVQILGEDGKTVDTVTINKALVTADLSDESDEPIDIVEQNPAGDSDDITDRSVTRPDEGEAADDSAIDDLDDDGEAIGERDTGERLNDVTIGAYSLIVGDGPTFETKREEARAGFESFLKAAPAVAPLLLDLYAKAHDWPFANEVAERIEATLPPPVQAILQREKMKKAGVPEDQLPPIGGPQQPQGPNPAEQAATAMAMAAKKAETDATIAKSGAEVQTSAADVRLAELKLIEQEFRNEKARLELAAVQAGTSQDATALAAVTAQLAELQGMFEALSEIVREASPGAPPEIPPQGGELVPGVVQPEGVPTEELAQ